MAPRGADKEPMPTTYRKAQTMTQTQEARRAEKLRRAVLTNTQTRIYRAKAQGRHAEAEEIAAAVHQIAGRIG